MESTAYGPKGDKAAEEKFKEASEAYHVLSDKERRQNYDQFGHAAFDGSMGGGFNTSGASNGDFASAFSDVFEDLFGDFMGGGNSRSGNSQRANRGADLRYNMQISLKDSFSGKKTNIDPVIEPQESLACIDKAKELLNWEPKTELEDWMKKYKKNLGIGDEYKNFNNRWCRFCWVPIRVRVM